MSERATGSQSWADAAVGWTGRHWLLLLNSGAALYAGLPWLSPIAKASGHPVVGELLFRLYTPLCHQLPERSFFCYGHQVAFCHRCAAMYTAIVVAGLLFGLLRRHIRPLGLRSAGWLLLPILVDGISHMVDDLTGLGLRGGGDAIGTPNFWLRMVTGALVGVVALLAVYPRLERDLAKIFAPAPAKVNR